MNAIKKFSGAIKLSLLTGAVMCSTTALAASPSSPTLSTTSSTTTTYAKKWRPGHYMLMPTKASDTAVLSACSSLKNEKNVPGIMVRIPWSRLETAKGKYDWSFTDQLVENCAANNKLVFIFVLDRTFGGKSNADSCLAPEYVKNLSGGTGCMASAKGGLPALHKAEVMDRLIALTRRVGWRYDSKDGFGGMQSPETATGFDKTVKAPADYTHDSYAQQLIRLHQAGAKVLKRSIYIAGVNWFNKAKLAEVIDAGYQNGVAIGGPDVLPLSCSSGGTAGQDYFKKNYAGVMGGMFQIQAPEMMGDLGLCSVNQLVKEGQQLGMTHYFWLKMWKGGNPGINWSDDILPAIRKGLSYNSQCPSNFKGGCEK